MSEATTRTAEELEERRLAKQAEARFRHQNIVNSLDDLQGIAKELMPAFRDKFDFSEEDHYNKMADMAYKAASALLAKRRALLADANAKLESDLEKIAKETT